MPSKRVTFPSSEAEDIELVCSILLHVLSTCANY